MEERLNEDIKNDFAEEMVWLTLVNELASAAVLRDHEDERSFTEGVQLVLRDLTEESLEVEVRICSTKESKSLFRNSN